MVLSEAMPHLSPSSLCVSSVSRFRLYAVYVAVASCAACGTMNAVRIDPASPSDRPIFVLTRAVGEEGPPAEFYGLAVVTCKDDSVMWRIAISANVAAPARVVYGTVPAGFTAGVTAHPLVPGCYRVYISGPAHTTFTVSPKSQ